MRTPKWILNEGISEWMNKGMICLTFVLVKEWGWNPALLFSLVQWSQHHVSLFIIYYFYSTLNFCCIWIFLFSFCFPPLAYLICSSLLTWCLLSLHLVLSHTSQQSPNDCWLCLTSCPPGCLPQKWSQWLIPSASSWPFVLGSIFYLSPLCCWCVSLFT